MDSSKAARASTHFIIVDDEKRPMPFMETRILYGSS